MPKHIGMAFCATVVLPCAAAWAQNLDVCADQQKVLIEISKQVQTETESRSNALSQEAQDQSDEIAACFAGPLTMERQHVAFDIPEFWMETQTIKMDLPVTWMENKDIIFDTPSVRCENEKTGQYPEFYCDTSYAVPKCTTRWSDIITTVCKPFMERQRIVMGIPQFKMETKTLQLDLPQVKMSRLDWYFDLPQFHIEEACVGAGCKERCENMANDLKASMQTSSSRIAADAKLKIGQATHEYFRCQITAQQGRKIAALAGIDAAIAQLQAARAQIVALGPNADTSSVDRSLAEMRAKRDEIETKYDQIVESLSEQEKAVTGQALNAGA